MARHGTRLANIILQLATGLSLVCAPAAPAAAEPVEKLQRLRTESQTVRDAVARGLEASASFLALHEALDATDGMVYIDEATCRTPGMRACLYLSMRSTGTFRLLRIAVSPRRAPGCLMLASIGHELRHALEALSDARVRRGTDMYLFFQRISIERHGAFETQAAIDAGDAIHKEACKPDGGQVSKWARTSGSENRQMTLSMK